MRLRDYEVLAKMIYDEPLSLWRQRDSIFSKWYIVTQYQRELMEGERGDGYYFVGDKPPGFVSRAWSKKGAWKKATQCKK